MYHYGKNAEMSANVILIIARVVEFTMYLPRTNDKEINVWGVLIFMRRMWMALDGIEVDGI